MKTLLLTIITLCVLVTCINVNDIRSAYVQGPSVIDVVGEEIGSFIEGTN